MTYLFASKIKYFTFVVMKLLRYIAFPLVPFYYLATWSRNKLYDFGMKSSTSFDIPVICVGNLSVGGTGKTPMIEYLIRLLKNNYKVATLSRGYKRKTNGFVVADKSTDVSDIGDEPFQFFKKFKDIIVGVDTNRRNGIEQILALDKKPDVILLDDGFQHRRVKAGFNILLTPYNNLYSRDIVLPTGNLREPISGAKRADVIVVTKCPDQLSEMEKQKVIQSLNPKYGQHIFFSSIAYSEKIRNSFEERNLQDLKKEEFTLVTGIANAKPLISFLDSKDLKFEHLDFKDHHEYSEKEIEQLKNKKLIVTTEKDFMRLGAHFKTSNTIFYLPIETEIVDFKTFDNLIAKFVRNS